ncbi:3-hydroxylacyl-ACP dehydratase [Azospirillum doebereinerae]|uniref:3-hydroxylacyl-ACP dehydratase n=1 Tax=Azospirillum doebereinerae TaxID=92933 RepID=A0A3S0XR65_9PROT|nr:3-hydroxylacyl-ACP dehydratase [Azospirillum doebereinerae]RUQ75889.1 3-hydroxylacyl-ACP dehydratase [Azospirillum doebereinerae]
MTAELALELLPCPWPMEQLLPHAPPMILLDRVLSRHAARLTAGVTVRPDAPFFRAGRGIAAHIAIEWMAQACGAFVGAVALEAGGPVRLGFLLGSRDFHAARNWFPEGETLTVSVAPHYQDGEMAVFDCVVATQDETPVATAQLTLYQPVDAAALLASQGVRMK